MTAASSQRFGRYELHGLLGHGGFATVYRAFDPALSRDVALKALLPHLADDADVRRRFIAEAQSLARFRHANIVAVYDVGEANGLPFFTMELVDGETLAPRLARGPLDLASLMPIVTPLASALDYLHGAGIVHRDIKPGNIMIERSGRPVLMDFGVARTLDGTQHTATGATLGTPAYMAPEQVRGLAVGPAADIYALGTLVYQLLSGRTPFAGDTAYMLHAQAYEAPPPLAAHRPDLPPAVCLAVEAALAKDPRRRPPSASAFAADLAGTARPPLPLDPDPPVVYGDPTPPTIDTWPRPRASGGVPRAALVAGAAVLVVAAAGIGAFAASQGGHSAAPQPAATAALNGNASASAASAVATAAARPGTTQPPSPAPPTAAPTATPAPPTPPPTAPPTVPPPVSVESLSVDAASVSAWADGRGLLQVPVAWRNASNDQLQLRIVAADNPSAPAVTDTPVSLPAPSGNISVSVAAPSAPLPAGIDYVARLYRVSGADWSQLTSYEFSVPRRAAPAPPATVAALSLGDIAVQGAGGSPRLVIEAVAPDTPAVPRAGEAFSFRVTVLNGGGGSGPSSITVSSPNAQQLSSNVESCAIAGAQIDTHAPGQDVISVFSGDNASRQPPAYWTTEVYFPTWTGGRSCTLHVTAQLPAAGSLTLQIRATSKDPAGHVVNNPLPGSSGGIDEANLPVLIWNVPAGQ